VLQLRPNCESCNVDLPAGSGEAHICSFECTFCARCAAERHHGRCPNCGGELTPRPTRVNAALEKYPASTDRLNSESRARKLIWSAALQSLPGPGGAPYAELLVTGRWSMEIFAPVGIDTQAPHNKDEVYVVIEGGGSFQYGGKVTTFGAGDLLFVPAGLEHRFVNFSSDLKLWVIFNGAELRPEPRQAT